MVPHPWHLPLDSVPPDQQFSSEQLVNALCSAGKEARYFPDTGKILSFLDDTCCQGDVVAILSNGGFDNIHERLLERLRQNDIQ